MYGNVKKGVKIIEGEDDMVTSSDMIDDTSDLLKTENDDGVVVVEEEEEEGEEDDEEEEEDVHEVQDDEELLQDSDSSDIKRVYKEGGVDENESVDEPKNIEEAKDEIIDDQNTQPYDQHASVEEGDESRSEATFHFTVKNFSEVRESVLSESCIVRNLPWKIMIMPRNNQGSIPANKSLGYFLQCNGEAESGSWSCQASAELRILSANRDNSPFTRQISHVFNSKENDWGYSTYKNWNDIVDPANGFIENNCVTFEVRVVAEAPHGVCWDSKKHTGYVGLKNQGATCYMNSLLQVLYFTNKLRRSVYKMPTEADDSSKSVALALQRVFHDLQFCDKSVGTKKLTKSFGWEAFDSFLQHDVQEFLRVLIDKLEIKMKGTRVEGQIPKLFEGEMVSFIKCKNVDYTSSRTESFYDIQLNIKGKKDIYQSFADYTKSERLDGENKYDAGHHGLQDADKGILFTAFPPVLHLHLMRFQYDPITDCSIKFNDRFEFPRVLNLTDFLSSQPPPPSEKNNNDGSEIPEKKECVMEVDPVPNEEDHEKEEDMTTYLLHAVLVHSGDNHGGHYVVFINPACDNRWCKFDDDVVSTCSESEAIQYNYGGSGVESNDANDINNIARQSTNAYMLVYIRKSAISDVLCNVSESHIPPALLERLSDEKKIEMTRRKEKSEASYFITLRFLVEDQFVGYQGNDLYDPERTECNEIRVRKTCTLSEVLEMLSEQMNVHVGKLRLWLFCRRDNNTVRPQVLEFQNKPLFETFPMEPPFIFFLQIAPLVDANHKETPLLPPFHPQDVLLFFKYYDPYKERIHYVGHMLVPADITLISIVPELLKRAHLLPPQYDQSTSSEPLPELTFFEEVRPNSMYKFENLTIPLKEAMCELMDGDIIVFEKTISDMNERNCLNLPSATDYFTELFFKIDVCFIDKMNVNDNGFIMSLSLSLNFDQFCKAVSKRLGIESRKLQFFKPQPYRDGPGPAIKIPLETPLKEFSFLSKNRQPKKLYYQKLSISLDEMESKQAVKCNWLSLDQKVEKELILYPNKTGTISDILEEVRSRVNLSRPNAKLRMLDIIGHRISDIQRESKSIVDLSSSNTNISFRVEEIPESQMEIHENEMLMPVVHFHKDISSCFSHPFLIKIRDGQTFASIRNLIQQHLSLSDKEFDKYNPALISKGRVRYFQTVPADSAKVCLKDFPNSCDSTFVNRPSIGLEHVNKNSKRARYNYTEKAIKIYN